MTGRTCKCGYEYSPTETAASAVCPVCGAEMDQPGKAAPAPWRWSGSGIALGLLWGLQFPIIKRIWTSSYCLVASGCSAMMLGVFYLVVDVWRWQKWCVPFLWIGTNALTVYLAVNLVDFNAVAARFGGGDVQALLDTDLAKGIGGRAV